MKPERESTQPESTQNSSGQFRCSNKHSQLFSSNTSHVKRQIKQQTYPLSHREDECIKCDTDN